MTLPQFKHTVNGASVYDEDFNTLGESSARGGDEALRHLVLNSGLVGRSMVQRGVALVDTTTPIITSGASGISCGAFTAWIGAQSTDSPAGYADVRSVLVPAGAFTFPVPANGAFDRIDMILAKYELNIDAATVDRKVKDPTTGVVSDQPMSVTQSDRVTFVYVQAVSASVPTWPVDPAGGYYIPLALVYVHGWAGTGTFPSYLIEIVADTRTKGDVLPMSTAHNHIGAAIGGTRGTLSNHGHPINISMPANMAGCVERLIPIGAASAVTGKLIDDSVDWRNRIFNCNIELRIDSSLTHTPTFPWQHNYTQSSVLPMLSGLASDVGAETVTRLTTFGQSMKALTSGLNFRLVAVLLEASPPNYVYVDDDGALRLTIGTASTIGYFIWLRASAQYNYPEAT